MKRNKTPPVDIRKVLRAAAEAALEEPAPNVKPRKRHVTTGRVMMLGAGLIAAGGLLAGGRNVVGSLQDHLQDLGVKLPGKSGLGPTVEEDMVDDLIEEDPEEDLEESEEGGEDERTDEAQDELDDLRKSRTAPAARPARRQRRSRG